MREDLKGKCFAAWLYYHDGEIDTCNSKTRGAFKVCRKEELDKARDTSKLFSDLLKRTHEALGGTTSGEGSDWSDMPERVAALKAKHEEEMRKIWDAGISFGRSCAVRASYSPTIEAVEAAFQNALASLNPPRPKGDKE